MSFLIATGKPEGGHVAVRVSSSNQPLKTQPEPPSPSRLPSQKSEVARLNWSKGNDFGGGDDRISLSEIGVGKIQAPAAAVELGSSVLMEVFGLGSGSRFALLTS